jgi:tetratricopeptide (TPR) repeat protein
MADWKDFVEDNRERAGQLLDFLEGRYPRPKAESVPPVLRCPVCVGAFYSVDSLEDHIVQVHGPQHVYLRVDGSIVREFAWAERAIESISVVLLGHLNARVHIHAGPTNTNLEAISETRLEEYVPRNFEGELQIEICPKEGKTHKFTLYCRSLPEFRQDDLDRTIWDLQQAFHQNSACPDLRRWRESCGVAGKSSTLEDRYVNGFYEYTLGFALEKGGDSKAAKEHFEDAFGCLLPFRTVLGEQAQCVLALKMNCFGVLERCADDSLFAPAHTFFMLYPKTWKRPKKWPARDSFGVYADRFTTRLPHVIASFYSEDDNGFWQGVEALKFHPAARDKNNFDKLQLLQARAYVGRRERAKAKDFYRLLRYNPQFGVEAEEFLGNE